MLHNILAKSKEDFEITISDGLWQVDDDYLKNFQIVHFHKAYQSPDLEWYKRCRKAGAKIVVDFDDWWHVPMSHGCYAEYYYERVKQPDGHYKILVGPDGKPLRRKYSTTNFFIDQLKGADYVTCTTPMLADEIRPLNKNVEVFENGANPDDLQWKIEETKFDKIRIGWIGGSMHWSDIQLLRGTPNRLANDPQTKGKYQLRLFGYVRGSVFVNFANIFTDYGKYVENCRLYPPRPALQSEESRPAYTQYYNELDIAWIPLVGDKFNSLKSELKLVEAGFFQKPVIVSDVWPYKYIINDSNALIIRHKTDWFKKTKRLIADKSLREDLGWKLYDSVREKYDARRIAKRLGEFYKTVV